MAGGKHLFMRINAKTVSVLAALSAIVVTGAAIAYYELYMSANSPSAILKSSLAYIHDIFGLIISTGGGRTAAVAALVLCAEVLFVGWRGSSLFRLTVVRSKSALLDLLNLL